MWGGKNVFDAYSEDFCGLEEGDDGPILHLMLQTDRGFTRSKLPLDQRITARDGKLLYSTCSRLCGDQGTGVCWGLVCVLTAAQAKEIRLLENRGTKRSLEVGTGHVEAEQGPICVYRI